MHVSVFCLLPDRMAALTAQKQASLLYGAIALGLVLVVLLTRSPLRSLRCTSSLTAAEVGPAAFDEAADGPLLVTAAVPALVGSNTAVPVRGAAKESAPDTPHVKTFLRIVVQQDNSVVVRRMACRGADGHAEAVDAPGVPLARVPPRPSRIATVMGYMYEEELLHVRLAEHYELMDHFIIVEGAYAFGGEPKPLHFQAAMCGLFAPFLDKVVHVVTNATGPEGSWEKEYAHRVGGWVGGAGG